MWVSQLISSTRPDDRFCLARFEKGVRSACRPVDPQAPMLVAAFCLCRWRTRHMELQQQVASAAAKEVRWMQDASRADAEALAAQQQADALVAAGDYSGSQHHMEAASA